MISLCEAVERVRKGQQTTDVATSILETGGGFRQDFSRFREVGKRKAAELAPFKVLNPGHYRLDHEGTSLEIVREEAGFRVRTTTKDRSGEWVQVNA